MIIVPYKADHLMRLQLQPGQLYAAPAITPEYAKALENEFSFSALHDGKVLAVGGIFKLWDNRGLAWTYIDRDAGAHFLGIHRAVQDLLRLVPYDRVEADTPCEFEQGRRWLEMLGFTRECDRARKHRPDGGDSALYAKVR